MAKKPDSTAAALNTSSTMQAKLSAVNTPAAIPAVHTIRTGAQPRQSKQTEPARQDRRGRVSLVSWQPEQARRNLKMMAAAQGRDVQDLILEALNDLFAKHNMPHVQGE